MQDGPHMAQGTMAQGSVFQQHDFAAAGQPVFIDEKDWDRIEDRTSHVSIIKYSYPTIASKLHNIIYDVSDNIVSAFPSQEDMVSRILRNRVMEKLVATRKNTAVTVDISGSGMGICTTKPLITGDSILIYNNRWHDKPVPATVRWCKRHTDLFFRAGLLLM